MSDRDSNGGFLWFLAGVGLGALAGVLYAPRSGRETREALLNAADEGREFVSSRGQVAREQVQQWTAKGKEAVGAQKEQFRAAYEAGRQAYREATETSTSKT
jgi:gas vesicle protein